MKLFDSLARRRHAALGLTLLASVVYLASSGLVSGADPQATNTPPTRVKKESKRKPSATKLDGAQLYAINCSRCHPERYPMEFNSAQWKTLMLHMRVRANLPAKQAKEILKYLEENCGK